MDQNTWLLYFNDHNFAFTFLKACALKFKTKNSKVKESLSISNVPFDLH